MTKSHARWLVLSVALGALPACNSKPTTEAPGANAVATNTAAAANDPVSSAMSAAPEAVARNAAVMSAGVDGKMTMLREGTNGWTCMPDNPVTPGPDPMCGDGNAMKWAAAWIGHQTPPADTVGVLYMLAGGTDASNTDPYAQKPSEGNAWVETGPHLMVVGSQSVLQGYPTDAKPDTKSPYVMWSGTPYAHLMIPTG